MIISALVLVFVIISILLIVFRGIIMFVVNWLIDLYYRIFKKQERVNSYNRRESTGQNHYGYNTGDNRTATSNTSSKKKGKIFSDSDGEYVDFEEVKK